MLNVETWSYSFKHARVLTITKSKDQIRTMIEANKKVDERRKGIRMFLFTQTSNYSPANVSGILLDKIWLNGREELVSLID